jgi:septal ring factor EnvC (AmiA/AmiB activator)
MRNRARIEAALALILLAPAIPASAQHHRDPFTQPEIDQIRDTSWEPQLRLSLYVQFARARLVAIEQMRSDPKTKNRAQQTHDRLDDFQLIYDELNDNIDTYVSRQNDIRKPLKLIVDADTEFQAKLRALKDASDASSDEARQYEFVLSSALETVDSSAEDHRKLLAEQLEAAKHRRKFTPAQPGGRSE